MSRVTPAKGASLTPREREVLAEMVRSGDKTDKHIGRLLNLSPATVRNHVYHLFKKLGVNGRNGRDELCRLAIKFNLVA